MTDDKVLLVGLGNPGREYRAHRHNVGFMLLEQLAKGHNLSFSRVQHQALVTTGRMADCAVVLAKPQTFMNASGRPVSQLLRFFKIPLSNLLVAYDDLDLPLGSLRFRSAGGSGGHKGVQSILEQVGSDQFARLRLGIGRPPGQMDPADYVLQSFRAEEEALRDLVLAEAAAGVMTFLQEGITMAMSRHNGPLEASEAAPATRAVEQ